MQRLKNFTERNGMILVKWLGTILCLVGILLTSFNFFPANIIFGLIGSALWTLAAIYTRDIPLLLVEVVSVLFYLSGIVVFIWRVYGY